MKGKKDSNKAKKFFIILIISILASFLHIYIYALPDYRQLFNPYEDRIEGYYGDYFDLLKFTNNNIEPGNTVLFIEFDFYRFGHPYLYPEINSKFFDYINGTNDSEFLDYLKEITINYVLIYNAPFHLSTNTTLFLEIEIEFIPTSYLLQVNRTAL